MKHLCKLKYKQEITKQEVEFFKQKLSLHTNLHVSQWKSMATLLPFIENIQDVNKRKYYHRKYRKVTEQARQQLIRTSMGFIQERQRIYEELYVNAFIDLRKNQKNLSIDQQLTEAMRELMSQRLTNISTHLKSIYVLKTEMFRHELNMKTNLYTNDPL